jgi:hypothetical protein
MACVVVGKDERDTPEPNGSWGCAEPGSVLRTEEAVEVLKRDAG